MKIIVKVHPGSKKNLVKKISDTNFELWFNTPPIEGRANEKTVEILAKYFKTSKSRVSLVSGGKSKVKTFDILDF